MSRVVIGALLALQLSGCGTTLTTPAFALEQADDIGRVEDSDLRTITVVGEGSVKVPPDLATVTLGVEAIAKDAGEVQATLASRSQAVIARWRTMGVPETAIQTVGLNLYPEYARPKNDEDAVGSKLVGYRGSLRLQVKGRPDQAGTFVDAALAVGANRLEGVAFSREALDAPRQEAIRKAVAQAMSQAKDTLGPLSLTVKEIRKISVSASHQGQTWPTARHYAGGPGVAPAAMPVAVGELEVRAVVTVVASF